MVSESSVYSTRPFLGSHTLSLVDSPEPEPVHATPITMKMTTPLGPPPHRPLNPIHSETKQQQHPYEPYDPVARNRREFAQ